MLAKSTKTTLQTLLFAIIGIVLVYWRYTALSPTDKDAMFSAFQGINWWWIIPILILSYLSHYFRAVRWQQLLQSAAIFTKRSNAISAVFVGYLANLFVPRLGEVAKCTVLAKYEQQPVETIIGTIIVERIFDVICFLVIFVLTILVEYNAIFPYALKVSELIVGKFYTADGLINYTMIFIGIAILLLGLLAIIFVFKKIKNNKLGKIIAGFSSGIQSILNVKSKGLFLLYSLLIWIMYTAVAIMVYKAMPSLAHLPLGAGLSIITFGSIAMMVPAPGGIAYPIIVAPVMVLYGVNEGLGQAYGWINWSIQNIAIIIFGLAAFIALPIINSKKNEQA